MSQPLRVLILDDSENDASLMVRHLASVGYDPVWERVEDERAFVAQLAEPWDVVLADYQLPHYDALQALRVHRERQPDTPFIIVTGVLGDQLTAEIVRRGAADYLLKDGLARLGQAVKQALERRALWEEQRSAQEGEHRSIEEVEARAAELTLKARELEARNRLLRQRLDECSTIVEAYRRLLDALEANPQDVEQIVRRARAEPLPDLSELANEESPGSEPQ